VGAGFGGRIADRISGGYGALALYGAGSRQDGFKKCGLAA
jgi:hypothetical protein